MAYNLIVPTPFYHLSVAEELLRGPDLPFGTCDFLNHNRPESLFGDTAPNVQTISGPPRPATRFQRADFAWRNLPRQEVGCYKESQVALRKIESQPPAAHRQERASIGIIFGAVINPQDETLLVRRAP